MKKILFFIALLFSVCSYGQVKQVYNQYGGDWKKFYIRTGLRLPQSPVSTKDLNLPAMDTGQIYYNPADSSIYYHTGFQWIKAGIGGGSGGSGITSIGAGLCITIVNDSTVLVDTACIATYFLRITDTANMRARLYAGTNINITGTYPNQTITSTAQAPLKLGRDFTFTGDSLFLKGAWVNLIDYGGNPNGVANNNAALTAAIATGKNIFVPRGRYVISAAIQLQAGQTIFGVGYNSVFTTTANDRILWTNDNTTITGLRFVGSGKGAGLTFQTGVFAFGSTKFDVSHCWFDSLSGAAQQNGGGGIYFVALSPANSAGARISNCTFYNNNGGLVLSQRAEYVTALNITAENNTVGVGIGAGNVTLTNGIIENNRTGILVYDGDNDGHGLITGTLCNHNDTAIAFRGIDYNVGFQVANSNFYYGKLSFTNSHNIKFVNCNFDALDSISINGSTGLLRVSSWIGKNILANPIQVNIFNGGQEFASIGEVRFDETTPNYWIKQQYADTVLFTGPLYLTGIPNGGVAADSVLVATSTGQVKKRDAASFTGTTPTLQQVLDAGSTLTSNETIATGSNSLTVSGSLGGTAAPISGANTGAGNSINANSFSGTGNAVYALSDISNSIWARSISGTAGIFSIEPSSTNTVDTTLIIRRKTTGTAANGIAGTVIFETTDTNGTTLMSNELITRLTTAAAASKTSQVSLVGISNAITDTVMTLGGYVTLTESSATIFSKTTIATGKIQGGSILVTIEANDATDFQSRTLRFIWSAVNKAGTTTITLGTPEEVVAVSAGTLTATITATDDGSGVISFKANAVSSLTQTTLRATYQVFKNF